MLVRDISETKEKTIKQFKKPFLYLHVIAKK